MRLSRREKINFLHRGIVAWYRKHQRELQWRTTTDPYEVLVSEVMLQQTQVSRVQEKLPEFLRTFPTFRALARSSTSDVVRAWQGMGYNNRAVRLRNMARVIERDFNCNLPSDISHLQSLPGVGPYTAHAVACFALKQNVPVVDVNIQRFLSRFFWRMRDVKDQKTEKEIWKLAAEILPGDAYSWNQALMDLGAAICTARKPICNSCPVTEFCASRHLRQEANNAVRKQQPRKEPMHDGIPQRIWRGKIVQTLRLLSGTESISLRALGSTIKKPFGTRELPWLHSVVYRLKQDGVVAVRETPRTAYISLVHE